MTAETSSLICGTLGRFSPTLHVLRMYMQLKDVFCARPSVGRTGKGSQDEAFGRRQL